MCPSRGGALSKGVEGGNQMETPQHVSVVECLTVSPLAVAGNSSLGLEQDFGSPLVGSRSHEVTTLCSFKTGDTDSRGEHPRSLWSFLPFCRRWSH